MALSIVLQPLRLTPSQLLELAAKVDSCGYDALWLIEQESDSLTYAFALGLSTSSVPVGSAVIRMFTRHPLLTVEAAAAVDRFLPGRFIIGLGTGPEARADPGLKAHWGSAPDRAVARASEYIDIVRLGLSGDPVTYHGEFYVLDEVQPLLSQRPDAPMYAPNGELVIISQSSRLEQIPVYLAAGGPMTWRLAGRKADGAFFSFYGPERMGGVIHIIHSAATQAGREPASVKICPIIPTCVQEDGAAARNGMRRRLFEPYLTLPKYQALLAEVGFENAANAVRTHLANGDLQSAADCIPDEALDAVTIAGTPDEARARAADYVASGADLLLLYPLAGADGDWFAAYDYAIETFKPQ